MGTPPITDKHKLQEVIREDANAAGFIQRGRKMQQTSRKKHASLEGWVPGGSVWRSKQVSSGRRPLRSTWKSSFGAGKRPRYY